MNILIIGGSSDIGINLAKYLYKYNNNILLGYNSNKVILDNIPTKECNVLEESSIEEFIKYGIKLYKKIDILINLASINIDNDIYNKTKKEFLQVLEVNLVGMFLCNKIYSKYFDDGLIINMSSTDGIDTYSKYTIDYACSKSGIITMSKIMSMNTNNKVLCICPNWIDSNSTNSIDKDYLDEELKRIKQNRLITIEELVSSIYNIINSNYESGSIIRIDIKDDLLWIEKI